MAQAMEMDELAPAQHERIAIIRRSGQSLLTLLNDILDMSKIEAGKLVIETIEFHLDDVIQLVMENNSADAASRSLWFEAATEDASGVYAGDPNRLRQIVQNLVSNALKFTEAGGVNVEATYARGWLSVRVEDTGIGIPADRLHKLFEKFAQADESTTRRFGGTGLGLSISRQLAQAMGGDISVESVAEIGSTFTLRVPLQRLNRDTSPIQALRQERPDEIGGELRVLAAEDNATNQLVLKTLLAAVGVTPTIVENGQEAVSTWSAGDWDVVLMDIHMPVMDGLTAVRAIRAAETRQGRPRTRIFALTADAMEQQVQEYAAAGLDGYLTKPVSAAELFAVLAESQPDAREADIGSPHAGQLNSVTAAL
jgi:CheY-like chemotaxis protein